MASDQAARTERPSSTLLVAAGGKTKRNVAIGAGVLVVVTLLDFFLNDIIADSSIRQLLMLAAGNVLVALSLNVINGMAGQFSIGHAGFIGIGGYTSAVMASHVHDWLGGGEITFAHSFVVVPLCLICSAGFAGLFGPPRGAAFTASARRLPCHRHVWASRRSSGS